MTPKLSILHLRASNFYGGPERQLHLHARLARDSHYLVTVGSFSEGGQHPEFLQTIQTDGIPTHLFTVSSAYDFSAVRALRKYLADNAVDILCTHDYRTGVFGYLATRRSRVRWVAFSRGFTQDNFKVRLYHLIDKLLIRAADHLVAVSHSQKEKLKRLFVSERKISVVPNAIDPNMFMSVEPINLHVRFNLPADATIVASGGRFSREKGQADLVRAAAVALESNPQLRFILFGDGPDLETIRQLTKTLGIAEGCLCPGFEPNLIGCLKGADILINPSLSEGLPNIVLEGMAIGLPIVATAVGGVPEIITDQATGFLVAPSAPEELANAILMVASTNTEDIVAAARDKIGSEYSFDAQFEKLSAVYDRLKVSA